MSDCGGERREALDQVKVAGQGRVGEEGRVVRLSLRGRGSGSRQLFTTPRIRAALRTTKGWTAAKMPRSAAVSELPAANVLVTSWSLTACGSHSRVSRSPPEPKDVGLAHLELFRLVPGPAVDLSEPVAGLGALLLDCAEDVVGLACGVRELFGDLDERSDVSEGELLTGGIT